MSIKKFNGVLDRGLAKQVFDHVRNYMMCALILAAGTTELRDQDSQFFDFAPPGYSGVVVVGLGVILMLLNLYDGIRRISRSKYHVLLIALLIFIYLFLSLRVVQMAWDFRDLA